MELGDEKSNELEKKARARRALNRAAIVLVTILIVALALFFYVRPKEPMRGSNFPDSLRLGFALFAVLFVASTRLAIVLTLRLMYFRGHYSQASRFETSRLVSRDDEEKKKLERDQEAKPGSNSS